MFRLLGTSQAPYQERPLDSSGVFPPPTPILSIHSKQKFIKSSTECTVPLYVNIGQRGHFGGLKHRGYLAAGLRSDSPVKLTALSIPSIAGYHTMTKCMGEEKKNRV